MKNKETKYLIKEIIPPILFIIVTMLEVIKWSSFGLCGTIGIMSSWEMFCAVQILLALMFIIFGIAISNGDIVLFGAILFLILILWLPISDLSNFCR